MKGEPITGEIYGQEAARQRTREFLLQEADRPLIGLLAEVDLALAEFRAGLEGVGEVQGAFKPGGEGEDAFSIVQIGRHVAGSGLIMAERLRSIGRGEQPTRATSPGNFGDVEAESISALAEPMHRLRKALHDTVEAIEEEEHLESVVPHPMFGDLNCRAYLRLIGLHFQDHTRQIEKIKERPDYPGS